MTCWGHLDIPEMVFCILQVKRLFFFPIQQSKMCTAVFMLEDRAQDWRVNCWVTILLGCPKERCLGTL